MKRRMLFILFVCFTLVFTACTTATPQIIEREVVVEKPVVETVVVEKEVVVERTVEVVVTPTPEAAPKGGTMTAAFDVGPGGFPERFDVWNATAGYYWFTMYLNRLVIYADVSHTDMTGDLAQSWEVSPDGTVYTFKLRQGVTWHDGKPFTAEDVKWSLDMVATPGVSRFATKLDTVVGYTALKEGEADDLSGVETVDSHTIRITLKEPNAAFLDGLTFIFIMPMHAMADIPATEMPNHPWWQTNPIGAGPFKWVKYEPGQYVELARFDDYWRGAPILDRLINRYFSEAGTAVLALEAGEIDFTYVTADEMLRLERNPTIEIIPGPSMVHLAMWLNKSLPVFQDVRVRQAFMHAIDREGLMETLWEGTAQVINCGYSAPDFVPDDLNPYPYDPAKAKELLDAAGFDYSQEFELGTYYGDQLSMDILAAVQQYLADVGIKATPRPMDVPTFVSEFYTEDPKWAIMYGGSGNGPDPDILRAGYHTEAKWPVGSNAHFTSIPALDAALDAGRAALTRQDRIAAYQEACRIMNEEVPTLWMWESLRFGATTGRIGNFTYTPAPGGGHYYNAVETWYVKE